MSARGRGRPPETSHDEIRDIARRLFAEQGYAATSLSQIAKAAGISRTTLFSYFPSKRDLVLEELDAGMASQRAFLESHPSGSLTETLAGAMVAAADYPAEDRDGLVLRWQLAQEDDDLRAYAASRVEEMVRALVDYASERAPDADPALVDHVARALMAVGSRCTEEWSRMNSPHESLDEHVAAGLRPFVDALRPLLG